MMNILFFYSVLGMNTFQAYISVSLSSHICSTIENEIAIEIETEIDD